jgi:PTH1 family peptidyl-tRNA hydrolase
MRLLKGLFGERPRTDRIIVGLGNPGEDYAGTRHNIGFRCVNHFARRYGLEFAERKHQARMALGEAEGRSVVLAKPRTFMNNSGEAAAYLLQRFSAEPSDLVVVYDDMDLPVGAVRVRARGSAGGHKGIASIIKVLETPEVARIRVGIGRPLEDSDSIDHVLTRFTPDEEKAIEQAVLRVTEALSMLLREGTDAAMEVFNRHEKEPDGENT